MTRDESIEVARVQENVGSFFSSEPHSSTQSGVIDAIQIVPLKNQRKGYNTKRGENASERENEFQKAILSNIVFLRNIAFKLTKNKEDAEDLLQETLLRAFKFFDKFQSETYPKAWLYRIMKNTHINSYRKSLREIKSESDEQIEERGDLRISEGSKRNLDPYKSLLNKTLMEKINKSLKNLPEEFRSAFLLCLVEGYSYKEASQILDCPIGTVMSRIHRARKILQKELEEYASEENESWAYTSEDEDDNFIEESSVY
jgi:RNA polymerase sigma-70 factor (ECF subfamily)